MAIQTLSIKNFRNISYAELEFSPHLNLITGNNAAGKTSFLEAIHFLGRAQSFRTSRMKRLIQSDASGFELFSRISLDNDSIIPIGVGFGKNNLQVRIQGESIRQLSQLAGYFPIQLMAGDIHQVLEDGPRYRRRFLDWGLFHVEPNYTFEWRRYHRALKQRNAALRNKAGIPQITIWHDDLIESFDLVNQFREQYLNALHDKFILIFKQLLGNCDDIAIVYRPGIPPGKCYSDCLNAQLAKDREQGFTQHGLHRADFIFQREGQDLLPQLSRGQQKLLIIAMQQAQAEINAGSRLPVEGLFLLDDIGAELDQQHQQRVLNSLAVSNSQIFITAIEVDPLLASCTDIPKRVFHVEHGNITELV